MREGTIAGVGEATVESRLGELEASLAAIGGLQARVEELEGGAQDGDQIAPNTLFLNSSGQIEAPTGLGLANPASFGAKLDGVSDDTPAFKRLHEAINAGLINGYYLTRTARISSGNLPAITRQCEIRFFNGAKLDFTQNFTATRALWIEGSVGEAHELTADAIQGTYVLSCATPFADGAILKLADPTTIWDPAGTNSHPGEFVEVGRPDGMFSGINGSSNTPKINVGEKLTAITITNVNANNPTQIWPEAGELELGVEVLKYTAREIISNGVKFTLEEHVAEHEYNQGYRVVLKAAAGTVYLRQAVSQEGGFTLANKSTAAAVTVVPDVRIIDASIQGPLFGQGIIGMVIKYAHRAHVSRAVCLDCWFTGIQFNAAIACHAIDPYVRNAREINMGLSGGNGYGVNFAEGSQDCSVRGGRTIATRHSVTQGSAAGGALGRRNAVIDHVSEGAFADAFDSHGGAADITWLRCTAVQPNGNGFNANCPKAAIKECVALKPGGFGVSCVNQGIGKTDYDIDCNVSSPVAGGITVGAASTTSGLNPRRIRIRGEIDSPVQYGVQINGSGQGNTISWKHTNVDIDVQVSNGPSGAGYQAVNVSSAELVRVRVQTLGVFKNNDQVRLRDVQQFDIHAGPLGWAEAGGTGAGVNVTVGAGGAAGGSTKGVIREGPMFNRGGESSKLENNVTNTWVYPGPDEKVSLGTGAGNQKVAVP